jgi:hypothetical protein
MAQVDTHMKTLRLCVLSVAAALLATNGTVQAEKDAAKSAAESPVLRLNLATFLGGSGNEVPGPLLLIKDSVYLAGNTTSSDFPVTPGAEDATYNGGASEWGGDAFVARFTLVGKSGVPTAGTR